MGVRIAVFSDVVCPWCFVGKRRLERALDRLGLAGTTAVEWLPFELNPDMPAAGMPRAEYRERKFGRERGADLDRTMTEIGAAEGIAFALGAIERTPNTRAAHTVLAHAADHGRADALKDALLRAYFEDARDIGDLDILLDVADGAGLGRDAVRAALADETLRARVVALERRASDIGVSGVPFFIVDDTWAVSGARSTEDWVTALTRHAPAA